jgi:hypothetical protein
MDYNAAINITFAHRQPSVCINASQLRANNFTYLLDCQRAKYFPHSHVYINGGGSADFFDFEKSARSIEKK